MTKHKQRRSWRGGRGRQRRLTRPCSQKGGALSPFIGVGGPPGTPMGEKRGKKGVSGRLQLGRKWKRFRGRLPKERIQEIRGGKKEKKAVPKCNFCSWYSVAFYARMVVHFPRRRMKPFSNEAFSIFASEESKGRKWRLKCTKFSILPKGSIYRQHLINRTPPLNNALHPLHH